LTRQYSLCNEPGESHRYLIAVLRDAASRGGSAAMHEQVHEGQSIDISTPKNHFSLAHDARHSLLLAGGIGVTPILCMAERLARVGAPFEVQALSAAGIAVQTSCEQGVCGTCLTRVLEGIPDHRDVYLTPDEQAAGDQFLPCCSRAKTPRLVLDL
jgi:hypothetical protein